MKRIFQSKWFLPVGFLILGVAAITQLFEVQLPARPTGSLEDIRKLSQRDDLNVVFVVIDTLRSDRLSGWGYQRETTPLMDRLASTGVRFRRTIAQSSWTKTSMASLWTGSYPVSNEILRYPHAIPDEVKLPAEILQEAGFRTAGIYRNGWVSPTFGFQQGFELYISPTPVSTPLRMERRGRSKHRLPGSDWDATLSAQEFLRGAAKERFFLYIHYMDVHQYVYERQSGKFGTKYSDAYDNALHWTDRNVGALVAELEQLDIMDRTLMVIASDHGEAFYEHGYEGHGRNLYREVIETPLIFILPFFLEEGVVVDAMVENVDVWPTILDLLGLPPQEGAQGRSLVPLMLGEEAGDASPAFAHLERNWARTNEPNPVIAVVEDESQLVYWPEQSSRVELFDHRHDPKQTLNVAQDNPEMAERMKRLAEEYQALPKGAWGAPPEQVEIDEMRLGILKALGYVIDDDEPH